MGRGLQLPQSAYPEIIRQDYMAKQMKQVVLLLTGEARNGMIANKTIITKIQSVGRMKNQTARRGLSEG